MKQRKETPKSSDLPIYLFKQGNNQEAYRYFGAHLCEENGEAGAVFRVWAPHAKAVSIVGDFNSWTPGEHPMEKVTEMTDKGPKEYERKTFPGYVLVKMILTDETWHILRNIRGVTGFVGTANNEPIPLTEEEVLALGMERREIVVCYNVGDQVKITDGPLSSFLGTVEEIDAEKNKVCVVVSMFGRETPVELELDQVEVVEP